MSSSMKGVWPGMTKEQFDKKLEKSIKKLKETYAAELAKKKCIKVISFEDRPQIIETKKASTKKKSEPKKKSTSPCKTCCATKMNGHKCTAKAKNGDFCGRHCTKSKK